MENIAGEFLQKSIKRFHAYKDLGDKTFAQLNDTDFYFQPNEASNSIAVIIRHMSGNMLSRWTNFLTEDGEKEWRNRDAEFEAQHHTREHLIDLWERGWSCMFDALASLTGEDLLKTIYIRQEGQSVIDAIQRQLAHYSYHVGQIVYLGRFIKDRQWQSLSIPKGQSETYNQNMKAKP
jgi:Protein of unknown function (DUF1572)